MTAPVGAIVLCGGQSSRMGQAKAWLDFGGEKMLQRVVRLLSGVANPIIAVGAPGQELPTLPPAVLVVRDAVEGRGPLQGLHAGLAALPEATELAYATGTDVPFLIPEWITRLAELIDDADLAIPHVDGFYHPLAAIYRRRSILPAVEGLLVSGQAGPVALMNAAKTRVVTAEELRAVDPALDTLRNLNTPADYRQALRDAKLAE